MSQQNWKILKLSLKECGVQGRLDGRKQVNSRKDEMTLYRWNLTPQQWDAYLAGFYRIKYPGSSNRRQRQHADVKQKEWTYRCEGMNATQ